MPTIDQLDAVLATSDADELPISQGGAARKITRGQLLTGLQPQLAISAGSLFGRSSAGTGAPEAIQLGAGLSLTAGILSGTPLPAADAVPVEHFGAVGDGIVDDTAAFNAAVAFGKPIRLGAKTYVVGGQWTVVQPGTILIGVPGVTTLKRGSQAGAGAWIAIQADGFRADGITFDANRAAITQQSWGVLVTSQCTSAQFHNCTFANAGGLLQGNGLTLQSSSTAATHVVQNCVFLGNEAHGLWVQACAGVEVAGCRAHDNGQYGICVDFNDPQFHLKVALTHIHDNRCWANLRGISVGNYNASNTQPPVWGNANPDANTVAVQNNICHDNAIYGIAAAGYNLLIEGNLLSNNGSIGNAGAGILANVSMSRVADTLIKGSSTYGIDCGGSLATDIGHNFIQGPLIGVNAGGGTNIRVVQNYIQACVDWAVAVSNVEADANGQTFGIASSGTAISGNWISMPAAGGGIWLRDGPQNVVIADNHFVGDAPASQALRPQTDSYVVIGNRYNFQCRATINPIALAGRQTIVCPDILEDVMVTYAPSGVQSMLTGYQAATLGQIGFLRITAGGTGYTQAAITISGAGTGAMASAVLANGSIIGAVVTAPGQNYGDVGTTVSVTIAGDGTGAQGTAYVSSPIPDGRRLRIACNTSVTFTRLGSSPLQENWAMADIDVASNADVEWIGTWNTWRATRFSLSDYFQTDRTGGALLRSTGNADVTLRPAGVGHVRLSSDAEGYGASCLIGRGSPQGQFVATPGSDYRNLNGGVGQTYWIKQSGSDANGWIAVA